MERGELVALVDSAPGGLRTLTATMRRWVHHGRESRARERLNESEDGGALVTRILAVRAGLEDAGRPASSEHLSRVWFASPNHWRVEGDDEHHSLDISDGLQRWQGLAGVVTERGRDPELAGSGLLGNLLAPGSLLGFLTFDAVAETERSGWPCIQAWGRPRGPTHGIHRAFQMEHAWGAGVLDHRFWFDATYGFVIRHEGYLDGEPAAITELADLVIDEPLDRGRFRVPAGTTIQTETEERVRHLERMGVDTTALDTGDPAAVHEALRAASDGGPGGGSSLEERIRLHVPWGPPPDDEEAARTGITTAYEAFGETGPDGRDLTNVQAGHGLAPLLDRARRRLPGATADNTSAAVDAVRFLGPDEAVVWFSIEVAGQRTPTVSERQGRAVRVGGRWLVEHATFADLLALGGVRVPPPDERSPAG